MTNHEIIKRHTEPEENAKPPPRADTAPAAVSGDLIADLLEAVENLLEVLTED